MMSTVQDDHYSSASATLKMDTAVLGSSDLYVGASGTGAFAPSMEKHAEYIKMSPILNQQLQESKVNAENNHGAMKAQHFHKQENKYQTGSIGQNFTVPPLNVMPSGTM